MTRRLVHLVGLLFAISAIYWLLQQLDAGDVRRWLTRDAIVALATVTLVYSVLCYGFMVTAWYLLLRSTGTFPVYFGRVATIVLVSQIGKYLPGNLFHHVGRVALARRHGLGLQSTLFTMFVETVWTIATAALLSLVALLVIGETLLSSAPALPSGPLLIAVVVCTIAAPALAQRLFARVAVLWARRAQVPLQTVDMPSSKTLVAVGVIYLLNYLSVGVVLYLLAAQVFGATQGHVLVLAGVFAIAWVAGLVTPGAPAGLGIRELVLVAALTPIYGNDTAVGMATLLRLVTTLGDGIVFVAGMVWSQLLSKPVG